MIFGCQHLSQRTDAISNYGFETEELRRRASAIAGQYDSVRWGRRDFTARCLDFKCVQIRTTPLSRNKRWELCQIDPSKVFSASFPPTMFIHGTADTVTPFRFSERAHEELKRLGVEGHLLPVVNENHRFDIFLIERDDAYQNYVMPGLKFLAAKAGLSHPGLG